MILKTTQNGNEIKVAKPIYASRHFIFQRQKKTHFKLSYYRNHTRTLFGVWSEEGRERAAYFLCLLFGMTCKFPVFGEIGEFRCGTFLVAV